MMRTYSAPRAAVTAALSALRPSDPLSAALAAGALDERQVVELLHRMQTDGPTTALGGPAAQEWAARLAPSFSDAAEIAAAADGMECEDVGWYGVVDPDDPGIIYDVVRAGSDGGGEHPVGGKWVPLDRAVDLSVLDEDTAGFTVDALAEGCDGVYLHPGNPICFLPAAVSAAAFSREERDRLAEDGRAMPDGSYPIVDVEDLRNAIQAIGRAKNPEAVKRHIKRRAKALGHEELIPEQWTAVTAAAPGRSVAVVAIPADDDPVHKASSEKGAHMTMAFLGDSDPDLDEQVESAVAAFAAGQPPFVLPATGREPLGDDKADVLMLDGSAVVGMREALVQSPAVAEAMAGTEQYPTWTPHVTLGYPESPSPTADQPAQVRFDKIGLWTDDYAGPTYLLGGGGLVAAAAADDAWTVYAVVDTFDTTAVMALIRLAPGPRLETWKQGAWTPDPSLLAELLGVAPPPLVELDDAQIESVMAQAAGGVAAAASPDPGAARLRSYWVSGKGRLKIKWGAPGDFRRCVKHLRKYMGPRMVKGYCFAAETEFITRDGVTTLGEAAGTRQFVLTDDLAAGAVSRGGRWVEAEVSSFGEQRLLHVTLSRGGRTKLIRATPEHRWFASLNGRNAHRSDIHVLTTEQLSEGMVLASLMHSPVTPDRLPDPLAFMAGFVYGDGSKSSLNRTRVDLWGIKQQFAEMFSVVASSVSPQKRLDSGVTGFRVYGLPGDWKTAPTMRDDDAYLFGWLAGYIAADGSIPPNGSLTISSSCESDIILVQDICNRLGIATAAHEPYSRHGYNDHPTDLHRICLKAKTFGPNLLMRSDQRAAAARFFDDASATRGPILRWKVETVEDRGDVEEVFCATVPGTESFALSDNIWSSNCANLHKLATGMWPGDRRNRGVSGSGASEDVLWDAVLAGGWYSATAMEAMMLVDGVYEETEDDMIRALTAGATFPVEPPDTWFRNPGLTGKTPLTVEDNGHVYGHVAVFDLPHIGMPGKVRAPKSRSNYAYFKTGELVLASGSRTSVGQLTLAGGHAGLSADAADAVRHYDDTASAVADVNIGEDRWGIWVAGAVRPEATPEQVRALRASAPSGDWRPINGDLELVAICQVNVPGFPVARARVAGGAVMALVAAGARPLAQRRMALLAGAAIQEQVDELRELVLGEGATTEDTVIVETDSISRTRDYIREQRLTRVRDRFGAARARSLAASGGNGRPA